MLASISHTTLLDDVLGADPTTNRLEALSASLLGRPSALLVLSGTMGNQLGLRAHLGAPPHSVVADARAHVLNHEAGGIATLSSAFPIAVRPTRGRQHLTLEDVRAAAVPDDGNIHGAPTRIIALENTLHGATLPLKTCAEIAEWARAHDIRTHLDGARLWETVAAQAAEGAHGGSVVAGLRAYAACFDSVTMCFSKGLGAPVGSVLVGGEAFVRKARHVRKMVGGAMRQTGVIAAPALVAVRETFFRGKLLRAHVLAAGVGRAWEGMGGALVRPVETNHVWLDLSGETEAQGRRMQKTLEVEAGRQGIHVYVDSECRIAFHYQISDEAVDCLVKVLKAVMDAAKEIEGANGHSAEERNTSTLGNGDTNGDTNGDGPAFKGYSQGSKFTE